MRWPRRRWVVAGLVGLVAVADLAAGHDWRATGGIDDPETMRRVILASVPLGSPLGDARRFLKQQGFRGAVRGDELAREERGLRDGAGVLWYHRSGGAITALVSRIWRVSLTHRDGRLVDLRCLTPGMVGP